MSKETIGPRIKAFRKGRGITQAELAKSLGYSHKSVITHIEKGESEMSYEKILLLIRTYAADANELFDVQHIDKLLEEHKKTKKEETTRNAVPVDIKVVPFTIDRFDDVIHFENDLRKEEDFWGWEIDDKYISAVRDSFSNKTFDDCICLLAYIDGKVVGRIDASMIKTRFDGSVRAYLDWICVLKSYRYKGVAQSLLKELCNVLKERGITSLVGLTAANEEAQKFYRSIPNSFMRDIGIWIDIK